MRLVLAFYWCFFWFLQGIDRFFFQYHIGDFIWFGRDHFELFNVYFSNLSLDQTLVRPVLFVIGFWHMFVAVPFGLVALSGLFGSQQSRDESQLEFMTVGAVLGTLTSLFGLGLSIVTGDQTGLLTHLVLMSGLVISLIFVRFSVLVPAPQDDRAGRFSAVQEGTFAGTGFSRVRVEQVTLQKAFERANIKRTSKIFR